AIRRPPRHRGLSPTTIPRVVSHRIVRIRNDPRRGLDLPLRGRSETTTRFRWYIFTMPPHLRRVRMYRLLGAVALVGLCVTFAYGDDKKPLIGHMVYFKLKDNTPENRKKLVDACDKYLANHDGMVFYSAGVISDDFKRDVNDRDWDVALHLVF